MKNKISLFSLLSSFILLVGCAKGGGYKSSEEGGIARVEISTSLKKEKLEAEEEEKLSYDQKKELATIVGIILSGMAKQGA